MKLFQQILLLAFAPALSVMLLSCGSTGSDKIDFDRPEMLRNYGENIIQPAYSNLQNNVNDLQASAETFAGEPTEANLVNLQSELKEAWLAWQEASLFQFGPAEWVTLRTSLNTYPTDTDKIDDNISSGDYTFGTLNNRAAEGFPALDYLLHGTGDNNQEILSRYTDDTEAGNRTGYLLDNIDFMKGQIDETVSGWDADHGDYIGMFLDEENAGVDVGSSMSMLFNEFVLHYERFFRDGKIAIPAGVRSAGVPRPSATEAYYGGYSLELATANFEAIRRFFDGRDAAGSDRLGLDDHLDALGAGDLTDEIRNELEEAQIAVEELSDPLSQQIEEDNEPVMDAFTEIHELVNFFKSDMTSVLGVNITYQDNDGD